MLDAKSTKMQQTKNRKSLLYILKQASESDLIASDSLNCICTRKRQTSQIKPTETYDCERRRSLKNARVIFKKYSKIIMNRSALAQLSFRCSKENHIRAQIHSPRKMALSRWLRLMENTKPRAHSFV